jgi:predicted dehydrogenase
MPTIPSRRQFLKSAALALPAFSTLRLQAEGPSPSEKVTLGCIGLGIHGGTYNLRNFLEIPDARVVAVCDVYADRCVTARDKVNTAYGTQDCAIHADFRELLARTDIDAVVISTPDHWHVLMSLLAARAGKDVFCEKPTLNIQEGRTLVNEIARTGIIYQGGIEDRSVDIYHRMAELVRNGRLGNPCGPAAGGCLPQRGTRARAGGAGLRALAGARALLALYPHQA